jgi:hypothetical protein
MSFQLIWTPTSLCHRERGVGVFTESEPLIIPDNNLQAARAHGNLP